MRIYWGKKILEWTTTAKESFDLIIYLNNKYALDSNSPGGYAGIF